MSRSWTDSQETQVCQSSEPLCWGVEGVQVGCWEVSRFSLDRFWGSQLPPGSHESASVRREGRIFHLLLLPEVCCIKIML